MSGKCICVCYNDKITKDVFDKAVKMLSHRGDIEEVFIDKNSLENFFDNITIVRDRLGLEPLYYMFNDDAFVCVSEMKALLPFVEKCNWSWKLNEEVLFEYMMFRYVAGKNTLVKDVYKILPGKQVIVNTCSKVIKHDYNDYVGDYFDDDYLIEDIPDIENLLNKVISTKFDTNTAILLSGGVDSSLLTILASKIFTVHPLNTISMVFDGYENTELKYSRSIVENFSTNHTEVHFTSEDFADYYLKAIWHNDEPINFANSVAIMYMSKYARDKGYSKLMVGEGADEVFAGYTFFLSEESCIMRARYCKEKDIFLLLNNPIKDLFYRESLYKTRLTGLRFHMHYTFMTYLQTVANRLDKMTKAFGMKLVCPFVDRDVVDASFRLPDNMKVNNGITKYVIKKIAEKYIDHEQIYRNKIGFSIPINDWLRKKVGLGNFVSILAEERTLSRSIYRRENIVSLLYDFYSGKEDTKEFSIAGRVWILLNLELWIRTFIEDRKMLI